MPEEYKTPSRAPFLIATAICGLLDAILIGLTIYTFAVTPDVDQVPVYVNQKLQGTENKTQYLSIAPVFLSFVFLTIGHLTLRWTNFVRKGEERRAYYVSRSSPLGDMDPRQLYLVMSIVFPAFAGAVFAWGISRCLTLLN